MGFAIILHTCAENEAYLPPIGISIPFKPSFTMGFKSIDIKLGLEIMHKIN